MLNLPDNPAVNDYINFEQTHFTWDGEKWRTLVDNVPDVLLGTVPDKVTEGDTITIKIDNYDRTLSYYANSAGGTVVLNEDIITWTLPQVTNNQTYELIVQSTRPETQITTTTITPVEVVVIDLVADDAVIITSFGTSSYNDGWIV